MQARFPSPTGRRLISFAAAIGLSALAVAITTASPIFTAIPWTLAYFAVALVAWLDGVAPAIFCMVLCSAAISRFVLNPAGGHRFNLVIAFQILAFWAVSGMILYLLRRHNRVLASLAESEMHYRSVSDTAYDVIMAIDSDSRIVSINPAVKRLFDYEPHELLGQQMPILMPERYRAAHLAGLKRFLATQKQNIPWTGVQLEGLRRNGEEFPIEISFGSYTSRGRQFFTGFIRDISQQRLTQTALLQNEKLAAVGRLASSIAHEINNPLESVINLVYLARGSVSLGESEAHLRLAEQELRRVSVIANRTLQFHKQSADPALVACNDLMEGCLDLYQGRLQNSQIEVRQRLRARRPALCIEGQIRQVLNNLIGNAIDALPAAGGVLTVRTRDATDWTAAPAARSGVLLTIADSGTGMSPQTLHKIFDPFFTTKGSGGAGLGLWISSQMVNENNGRMRVRSTRDPARHGTVFTLFLPTSTPDR